MHKLYLLFTKLASYFWNLGHLNIENSYFYDIPLCMLCNLKTVWRYFHETLHVTCAEYYDNSIVFFLGYGPLKLNLVDFMLWPCQLCNHSYSKTVITIIFMKLHKYKATCRMLELGWIPYFWSCRTLKMNGNVGPVLDSNCLTH